MQLRCVTEELFEIPVGGDLIHFRRREGRITGFEIAIRNDSPSAVTRLD